MIDCSKLDDAVARYKKDFRNRHWYEEKYKWEAVKIFQDNWDVNVDVADFANMLTMSLSGTGNLLDTNATYPRRMMTAVFAAKAPEEVRGVFVDLFDENQDVVNRIENFKRKSEFLLEKYGDGAGHHYQYENVITTYLWLRYPDKYYIYKNTVAKRVAQALDFEYRFKRGAYAENVRQLQIFYDEICEHIKKDGELLDIFRGELTDSCYPDPEYKTLTIDIAYYISKTTVKPTVYPENYTPGISVEGWADLLKNSKVFASESLEIVKGMKNLGGKATYSKLVAEFGKTRDSYKNESDLLGRRIAEVSNCPVYRDGDSDVYWPILYTGYGCDYDDDSYELNLRDEIMTALDSLSESNPSNYWWLCANPGIWSFSEMSVGEEQFYTLYNGTNNKRRIFKNFENVKVGDVVIGYESTPTKKIVCLCKITGASDGEKIMFEKTENLTSPINYATLKECPELGKMEFFANPNGSLFKVTKPEYECIIDIVRETNPSPHSGIVKLDRYDKSDFLSDVFMTEDKYDSLVSLLERKKNVILQGPPGVGKTFAATKLAYSMMGEKDDSRIEFVQFHQNYSYEDFVMGYKPSGSDFELTFGVFYNFCMRAGNDPNRKYFFIIDEINRGNVSKIFGELLMLIEDKYRGMKVKLAYKNISFSVPNNLYILGMMNTADRSLAMIDYALRRRFGFFEMAPAFGSDGFTDYQGELDNPIFDKLIAAIVDLNEAIEKDKSLGKGFCIGHSYLSDWKKSECTEQMMRDVVEYEIIPMLEEYWFDSEKNLNEWRNKLQGVFL